MAGVREVSERVGYRYTLDADGRTICPPGFVVSAVDQLRACLSLREHDIVVTTYPRSGTTWMQQLVLLLLRDEGAAVTPMVEAPWFELSVSNAITGRTASTPARTPAELATLPPPDPGVDRGRRVWKTHAPAGRVPWVGGITGAAAARAKIILVCRNPKDAAVSMLHHATDGPSFGWRGNGWDDFAPLFLEGQVESSSWWDWHRGWYDAVGAADTDAVLWVTYEEMDADLEAVARRVAKFLDLGVTDAHVRACVARARFGAMKADAARRDAATLADGGYIKKNHIREGGIGGWRSVMDAATSAAFDARSAALRAACPAIRVETAEEAAQ